MRVVHEADDIIGADEESNSRVLATEVQLAESTLSQARGLMFRSSIPEEFALILDVGEGGLLFGGPSRQVVHMLFMRFPIDVLWLVENEVRKNARLSPWTSVGFGKADRIIELPAGAAADVQVGDIVRLEGTADDSE